MVLTAPSSVTLLIAGIAGLCLLVLTVIVGTRLFASASKADRHLTSGMALAPGLASGRASAAVQGVRLGIAERTQRATFAQDAPAEEGGVVDASSDAASEQIFAQLNEYYAANISQGNTIFWASLLSMCLGFAIIFAGIVSAGSNGVAAIVAAVAGVLSQFIAATFLVVLRSTQQQATAYAQSLVELHLRDLARSADTRAVALGVQLLNEISSDRTNPANRTKASIATGLIVKQPPIVEPPAVTVEESKPTQPGAERRRGGTVMFDEPGAAERR